MTPKKKQTQNKILVLDTETSGLDRGDLILEIAIIEVDVKNHLTKTLYNEVVGYTEEQLSKFGTSKMDLSFAWIFDHSDLTPEMVFNAEKNIDVVIKEVQEIVKDQKVTCYWHNFDFYKFLDREPWNLNEFYKLKTQDIMIAAKDPCGLWEDWLNDNKNPKLNEAYDILCSVSGSQPHRALVDAQMAAEVLLALIRSENYQLSE
ncbi:MAG: 3'-5' exonuclease [Promethearchaeota archaeon]